MSIAEWLRRNARWRPGKEALIDGPRRFTYAAFNERVNRHANALLAMGLQRGDRVAVLLNNGTEAIEAFAACAKAGLVHVAISFRLAPREIAHLLGHSGSRCIIVDREYRARLDEGGAAATLERIIVAEPGKSDSEYERWLAGGAADEPPIDPQPDDNLFIVYTSGTTGLPKGALYQNSQPVAHAPVPALEYDIREEARLLLAYPHNSVAAMNMFYVPAWMVGGTVVTMDVRQFSADRWLHLVERERITHCHLVPTMLFRVLEHPELRRFDLKSLVTIGYGSAPMPRERVERLSELFGNILVQGYGMTETSSIGAVLSKKAHAEALAGDRGRLNACGRPAFGCELRVVGEAGREVAPGEIGEIVFRGPYITSGYWQDPERTAEAIRGGWLHSGDLATVDADGYVYIVDRKKDLIITGGANVSSREVEEVLYWHEAVREAAVIGKPDEEWGESIHAFVSLHEGRVATTAELIAFCRERLAHYKCPSAIDLVSELPKNGLGKVLKAELRAPFWQGRSRAVN